ncbi:thioredoxin family protein [Phaeovulum sp.]|uniref:thioredoxin family protein n=1 Tax=Phaeovulum sp. TaxID=2934796 RepID=UPI0039E3471F
MAVSPPVCDFGRPAPDFSLLGTDGRIWRYKDVAGPRGTLVMFICNHCPYVQSILDRILRDGADLQAVGVGVVAISANDARAYRDDSFENMAELARERAFPFPYLYDETQAVAKAYGAECTPDFFGFNAAGHLQYRGRLDASTRSAAAKDARRELYEAMVMIAKTGLGPSDQTPSMGCSIKWKTG